MTSIPELESKKRKMHEVFSKADAALHNKTITQAEHSSILTHYFGTSSEREAAKAIDEEIAGLRGKQPMNKSIALVAGFSIIMLSLFGVLFWSTGGITGAVVLNITDVNTTYTSDTGIPILLDGVTRVNVTGAALGDVTITLVHEGARYVIYTQSGTVTTPHASMRSHYQPGEQVSFTATDVSSAYLMTGEDAILLDGTTIDGLAPGAYAIKLIINETDNATGESTLSQETLAFTVSETQAPQEFNACGEACSIDLNGSATIEIAVSGSVDVGSIILSTRANNAPQLLRDVPDTSGTGTATIDISGVFNDPDGDALLFESSHHTGNTETFDGETFTVSGLPGTYTYIIYASDMAELTPSNIFSVTIAAEAINETNGTTNETGNQTSNATVIIPPTDANSTLNSTVNSTDLNITSPLETNSTNTTNTTGIDCSSPDPNARPLECIQGENSTYFKPEDLYLENKDGAAVGQLTPIGNLLIKGGLVEHSAGTAGSRDWVRGYADENGDFIPTLWIDSGGDLHLRGTITEANGNIVFAGRYTAITNQRGIILALYDARTGDLVLRGNIIPYRRSLG